MLVAVSQGIIPEPVPAGYLDDGTLMEEAGAIVRALNVVNTEGPRLAFPSAQGNPRFGGLRSALDLPAELTVSARGGVRLWEGGGG